MVQLCESVAQLFQKHAEPLKVVTIWLCFDILVNLLMVWWRDGAVPGINILNCTVPRPSLSSVYRLYVSDVSFTQKVFVVQLRMLNRFKRRYKMHVKGKRKLPFSLVPYFRVYKEH